VCLLQADCLHWNLAQLAQRSADVQEVVLTKDVKTTQTAKVYIYNNRQDGREALDLMQQGSGPALSSQPSSIHMASDAGQASGQERSVGVQTGLGQGLQQSVPSQSDPRGRSRSPKRAKAKVRHVQDSEVHAKVCPGGRTLVARSNQITRVFVHDGLKR
jgi:hypothetical protein